MYRPGDINFIKKDIALTLKRYPKLLLVEQTGNYPALKGELDLHDVDTGEWLETVQVYIQYLKSFPFSYPKVSEIGGRFSNNNDMHVNGDGTLCLATPPVEILNTRFGLTTVPFIEDVLIPNLAWRFAKLLDPSTQMKANSHGALGILEGYMEILGADSNALTLKILNQYTENVLPGRNDACICSSGKKYKHCHEKAVNKIAGISKIVVKQHLIGINEYLQTHIPNND